MILASPIRFLSYHPGSESSCVWSVFILYFETISGSGIAPSLGNYKTPHESAKDVIRGELYHILMLNRARSETGELEHTRHSGIESGHVLTTRRGEVGGATTAALDELRSCLH